MIGLGSGHTWLDQFGKTRAARYRFDPEAASTSFRTAAAPAGGESANQMQRQFGVPSVKRRDSVDCCAQHR
jgi:hypothetical protein